MRVLLGLIAVGLWACVAVLLFPRQWDVERPQTRIIERYVERAIPVPEVQYVPVPMLPPAKPKPRPPLKLHPDYK